MEVLLDFCNRLAVNIFEIYIILRFMDIIFCEKVMDKCTRVMIFLMKLILTFLVDYYAPYVWVNFIVSLCSVFLLTCCYEAKVWKRSVVAVGINLMLAGSEALVALMIGSELFGLFAKASNEQSIAFVLSRIIFWMTVAVIKQFDSKNKEIRLSLKLWIFEMIVLFAVLSELVIVCSQEPQSILQESILLFGAEITIYLLIYLYDCILLMLEGKMQSELIQKEKEYYHREAMILQENQETTRQFCHDWNNRIQVMSQLAEKREWQELMKYLSEVESKITALRLYSNTGNLTIDSIINSKLSQAAKKEISIISNVILPNLNVDSDDIVVILGNLLDNAIEACEYVKDEKKIELKLQYNEGCLFLHIQNTFDETYQMKNGEYCTRKKDKLRHGIGIKSVKNTVEKYNGITEIMTDKKLFAVDIMMYI